MAAPTPGQSSNDALAAAAQRAREFLEQGRWRKARDELKPLIKVDRDRYLPLLIEANMGLAREMSAKGQISKFDNWLSCGQKGGHGSTIAD